MASLRERVVTASERVMGAPERIHFMSLLRQADGYRLSPEATAQVASALRGAPERVEQNLDLMRLTSPGTWIEFPDLERRVPGVPPLPGTSYRVDVGVLITVDPEEEDRFIIMTAWDFSEAGEARGRKAASIRHAYAPVAFSRSDISAHAFGARRGLLGGEDDAAGRMLGLAHAYLPEGFATELHLSAESDGDDERASAEDEAMRDAVSEAAFGLAALLFLSSDGADVSAAADGVRPVGVRRGLLAPLVTKLFGDGFRREGSARNPRLAFRCGAVQSAAA